MSEFSPGRILLANASILARPPMRPSTTAVVVIDMVNWQVPREKQDDPNANAYFVERLAKTVIPNHQHLLPACRAAGMPIVYLQVGCYRPDCSDAVGPFRIRFAEAGAIIGSEACEVIPELAPERGDLLLAKTASGGFGSSALDSHLRNMGITHVLYTGVTTNACVMLTAAGGFDLGYFGTIVTDATAALTPEHQTQAENLLRYFVASLATTEEVIELLRA
ncbi:cysteine hydrolase [Bradyrhizobium diazoefficiens]|nr:cysteine hydrolase [Bradyrhizobium diazoefficiens]QQO23712.1 cysteine hydrolase [Bradyrhizobium diazoefficiens]